MTVSLPRSAHSFCNVLVSRPTRTIGLGTKSEGRGSVFAIREEETSEGRTDPICHSVSTVSHRGKWFETEDEVTLVRDYACFFGEIKNRN
jgi:hypothetical protein